MTYRGNITKGLILLASTRNRQEKYSDPRNADFSPHLEANTTDTRVQRGTHEIVIEEVSRHADGSPSHHRPQIGDQRDTKAVDHGDGH